MAGLFELQLPGQSRSRRSQDVQDPRPDSSAVRSSSPLPAVAAREIVSQVVAKRDAAAAATASSTSFFPWKRRASGQDSSRQSSDASPRTSADTSSKSDSQSPDRRSKYSDRLPLRRVTAPVFPSSPSSPRVSTSIDFTLTPSSPDPRISSNDSHETRQHAASVLAHAGLGIGLPPIAFPGQSSPVPSTSVSRASSSRRKTPVRPGTAHGNMSTSSSAASFQVQHIRRVKSFTKSEGTQGVSEPNTRPSGNMPNNSGDVLVFTRDRPFSTAHHMQSMPERLSRDIDVKGKGKASTSDAEIIAPTPENSSGESRGRRLVGLPPLAPKDREQSATRRTSWWPGRRRIDSSPVNPLPLTPPPIPQRSKARPSSSVHTTPSLPTFRPFSPLMDASEFPITGSPPPTVTSFDDRDPLRQQKLEDGMLNLGERGASIRRHHSMTHRTGGTHSSVNSISSQKSRPPSQAYSQSHRYSWSMSLSSSPEHNLSTLQSRPSPSTPSLSSPTGTLKHRNKPQTAGSSIKSTRRRSMTLNSPPMSVPQSPIHETKPLLLRRPVSRHNVSAGPPDPFLTGWGVASGTRASDEIPDGGALSKLPIEMQRTPSTSSGSTSSLSHSTPAIRSPRQRAGTTPPARPMTASSTSTSLPPPSSSKRLLRRLSSTFFSSPSTPLASPLEISKPALNSTASLSSALHSGAGMSSPAMSDASSPQWSRENLPTSEGSHTSMEVMKPKTVKPQTQETPEDYVRRLVEAVSKAEVAHVLAANGDAFHARALRFYIDGFNFLNDPLDVALRKLLMDLGLPRETQQIDRVMEAFAARYVNYNPGLFENDDHPYILAFSLIMLHTDAFNKSNKNKMTKADYVKNARLPGVPPEILECFFDNVVFAPFIFIEDPMDVNAQRGYIPEGGSRLSAINGPAINVSGTAGNSGGSTILGKSNKIDPYYLITQGLLDPLRADVDSYIPQSNPFLFEGTSWPWDTRRLHLLFAVAQVVSMPAESPTVHSASVSAVSTPTRRKSVALPSLGVGYGPFMGSFPFSSDGLPSLPRLSHGPGSIRITKAGVLARKEDLLESGKRSTNRKWREWSVVLTGSQLLFFRDTSFASQLLKLPDMEDALDVSTETSLMNPDEAVLLQDCVALFDNTYRKYENTFRFLMPTGRQFLCQASDERTLNDWISTINYACAFKTAGVSMRGLGVSHKDVEMTGVAAAASHLQDLRNPYRTSPQTSTHTYGSLEATRKLEVTSSRPHTSTSSTRIGSGSKLLRSFNGAQSQVDLELPGLSHLEGAQQLKATFDEVKAELAANGHKQQRPNSSGRIRTLSMGARPTVKTPPKSVTTSSSRSDDAHLSVSRNDLIRSCIDTWDSKIGHTQHELDSELRIARNLAILTPFQRATRDRIQLTIIQLAKRVKVMRIELARLTCYRFVLLSDLADEERHLEQAKRDALKAATERLSTEEGLTGQSIQNAYGPSRPVSRPPSPPSATESFHSAVNVVEGSGNLSTPLSMLSEDDASDFPFLPILRASISRNLHMAPAHSPPNPTLSDTTSSPAYYGHERFYTAAETPEEIAEEWNETRAAKRVSLVRLPSGVELSSVFGRQARSPNDSVRKLDENQHIASSSQGDLAPPRR